MVTSLRNAIKTVLGFKDGIAQGTNPTNVKPTQVGTYSKLEVDSKLAMLLGNGDLPLSQYGDLGFSAPNVSSRYEGATTTHCPIVYQVEQDGSRNYLRNGMDGQTAGVYLCKLFVDGNKKMTSYSPMATPWRPAWLPAGDTIAELLHSAPGQVAMRCIGTYNGKLPAGSSYFAISWGNATLNPELHTNFRVLTGLTQAGFDGRYMKGQSTLVLDNNGTGGYLLRFVSTNLTDPVRLEVLQLTSLTAASLTPATEVLGFTGTDCLGVAQSAAGQPPILASVGAMVGSGTAYFVRDAVESGFGPFQTYPILTVLSHNGNVITLSMSHETWAGKADGTSDRKVVTRVLTLNLAAKTCVCNVSTRGPVSVATVNSVYTISGTPVRLYELGMPSIGNYITGWSQCTRTGEVLAQSTQSQLGNCGLRYIPDGTYFSQPWLRNWGGQQSWGYVPNYPSTLGAGLGFPVPISTGLRVYSSLHYADVAAPNYVAPIAYSYPDGATGQWAVDSGRSVSPTWVPSRTMTVIPKSGAIRHVGMAERGKVGYKTVLENGTRGGSWSVAAALDAQINALLVATLGATTGWDWNFVYYRPGAIGHLVDPLVVIGYGMDPNGRGYACTIVYEITSGASDTVSAVTAAKVAVKSNVLVSTGITTQLLDEASVTSPMIIAEAVDYVCLCGSSPWNMIYVGNHGQPTLGLAVTASATKIIHQYQAHRYINSETLFYIPTRGPCTQNLGIDGQYASTVMTMNFLGNTYATADVNQGTNLVVASQAVYGSWNLYFAEEVRCQITGITGKMPKKTVDLRSIKANPASTTFYLYAKLTGTVFDYIVSATQLAADKTMVPIGTVVTSATQIASVNVQKTFSIDGFSLSQSKVAWGIPNSAGLPYSNSAVINWPGVAT